MNALLRNFRCALESESGAWTPMRAPQPISPIASSSPGATWWSLSICVNDLWGSQVATMIQWSPHPLQIVLCEGNPLHILVPKTPTCRSPNRQKGPKATSRLRRSMGDDIVKHLFIGDVLIWLTLQAASLKVSNAAMQVVFVFGRPIWEISQLCDWCSYIRPISRWLDHLTLNLFQA